ncbi:hypothetical protein GM3708_843 [Geminocystis sp. NIES-3708]|uniref:DUF3747 domain-containing protein n=1 Tax=Geminocystis sp. NIES-3708 TaxID=1615909 RepID=UPI0005FC6F4D|nr:DUF3747 domain-containing protein [Geminocystis sp. NIES-3708]BAQ60437.1 hypothetical protein GM3708_843 [Geminocystis sp. NIES-3708]
MIKSLLSTKLSVLSLIALSTFLPFNPAKAVTFQETEVNQNEFIAVAQPYGENKYNLIVIEQIAGKNSCWSEGGSNPVNVDLLLLNFDFSGHCRRSTDANGYSIRSDGQDYGLDILLNLVEKDGNLMLIGINRRDINQPPVVVGTAQGLNGQPMKIQLNPGWRFTKRTYEGKPLGHVYFSYDSATAGNMMPSMNTNNNQEMNNSVTSPTQMPTEGKIQEIVSPDIQSQKNILKPEDISVINKKEMIRANRSQPSKYNLSQSGFERMNKR